MLGYTRILCALDFDEHSTLIFLLAAALAKESNATLCVLHIARVPTPDMDVPSSFDADPRWEREARLRLEDIIRRHVEEGLCYEIHVKSGLPDVDIVREATRSGVDLIVIATHGRRGFSHLVLGSVTEHVIRDATCPVLVVWPPKPSHTVATSSM